MYNSSATLHVVLKGALADQALCPGQGLRRNDKERF